MHYLGSKARHAKEILEITLANRRPQQPYIEPFVGGGNIICKVPAEQGPRIANDKNEMMVALLDCLGNRSEFRLPKTMTEKEWRRIMKWKPGDLTWEEKALFAFAATGPTFGSMWAGQWAKDYEGKEGTRYRQAREAAERDQPGLVGIKFHHGSFADLPIPNEPCTIYCDPPYDGTTGYAGSAVQIKVGEDNGKNTWKASAFWKWTDRLVDAGHSVYVSEYKGPGAGIYPSVFTPELEAERAIARQVRKDLDANPNASSDEFHTINNQLFDIERRAQLGAQILADRWKVVWQKEVVSDFSASRGSEDEGDGGKKEMECLFHREA